jgi:hypothetical protein
VLPLPTAHGGGRPPSEEGGEPEADDGLQCPTVRERGHPKRRLPECHNNGEEDEAGVRHPSGLGARSHEALPGVHVRRVAPAGVLPGCSAVGLKGHFEQQEVSRTAREAS